MVSFQCDGCADTVKKPQLDKHRQRCWSSFTCLDCSTTFQNQDYKNHTSCISEAEKFQGALYKGPKKNQAQAPAPAVASTSSSPAPTPAAAAPVIAIHPSRLNQLQLPSEPAYTPKVQSYPVRGGGRFGRGGGRGGFAAGGGMTAGGTRYSATGENTKAPEGGMRSWGSAANSDAGEGSTNGTPAPSYSAPINTQKIVFDDTPVAPLPVSVPAVKANGDAVKKNKNKKKGDKKGTGSRANTRHPPRTSTNGGSPAPTFETAPTIITTPVDPPQSSAPTTSEVKPSTTEKSSKKRKLETESVDSSLPATSASSSGPVTEKTLKRLKKNLSKLSEKSKDSVSLSDFLVQAGKNKEKTIEVDEVLKSLKVSLVDGAWQLSV